MALGGGGVLIGVYLGARHKRHERGGKTALWPALLGLVVVAATAGALAPKRAPPTTATGTGTPGATSESAAAHFADIQGIVANRCAPCHPPAPTHPGFPAPPQALPPD